MTTDINALRTLGERLKTLRIAAGYSQARFAEMCGVSIPVVVRMESGDGGVRFATWIAALRALGKMQNLDMFLPEMEVTPYDEVEKLHRQRAMRSDCKRTPAKWKWGK